ncbi:hypothetical protein [Agarivorans litoreus]|uniref:hypothetical protein n=1 Tax=Agarivorans litoreus TaxID=1510455 RepID=UPI001C7D8F1A|nr:hypothetical protein [Agarivorans litoreus]
MANKALLLKNYALIDTVLKRIADEGPLMAKDFDHQGKKTADWASKPVKQALECKMFLRINYQQASKKAPLA